MKKIIIQRKNGKVININKTINNYIFVLFVFILLALFISNQINYIINAYILIAIVFFGIYSIIELIKKNRKGKAWNIIKYNNLKRIWIIILVYIIVNILLGNYDGTFSYLKFLGNIIIGNNNVEIKFDSVKSYGGDNVLDCRSDSYCINGISYEIENDGSCMYFDGEEDIKLSPCEIEIFDDNKVTLSLLSKDYLNKIKYRINNSEIKTVNVYKKEYDKVLFNDSTYTFDISFSKEEIFKNEENIIVIYYQNKEKSFKFIYKE